MASALGGEVVGQEVLCPGPGHNPKDRSLSVKPDPNSPGLFIVHSFCNDDFRACRDHVKQRLGMNDRPHAARFKLPRRGKAAELHDDAGKIARALEIWREARP
ncbi:MAG: hypothetical protein ACOC9Q_01535 [bacterium]